jgi:hypothetical protein
MEIIRAKRFRCTVSAAVVVNTRMTHTHPTLVSAGGCHGFLSRVNVHR